MSVEMLPIIMFATVAVLLFSSYLVAFVLGGSATVFALIGMVFDQFSFVQFFSTVPRIWGVSRKIWS
ncbi:hypothetical protein [Sulfitobacter geojensis]|uniref:hypothetical protein n=1 Tax=Sulfitobacter geojensis TaxID=1342299 RepID=UPI0009DD0E25|nr:hypothetical protein [Sulfitobacter geojensis]KHA54076.1 hypothetical protein Z947_105 [Sulfitobacter geojensis]NYI29895.1 TRAP-type mannitol/chloroaromatic compound transport system permease large subunit [Sulfitobacter geojensis]